MNGTHRNLGCTLHTPKCSPGAHWNKQFNIRVDTPPCCREKMLHVFRTVTHDLKAHNISHMVFGGAVLGYARNQQVNCSLFKTSSPERFLMPEWSLLSEVIIPSVLIIGLSQQSIKELVISSEKAN